MNIRQAQRALRSVGFEIGIDGDDGRETRRVMKAFQVGFAMRRPDGSAWDLPLSGRIDALTAEALTFSADAKGRMSRHHRWTDWKSKGNGEIKVHRAFVRRYERLADALNDSKKIRVVSGYRDPAYNTRIGGASRSQHLTGVAADIPPAWTLAEVKRLRLFTGIGINRSSGLVSHVDMRAGDVTKPTTWFYDR